MSPQILLVCSAENSWQPMASALKEKGVEVYWTETGESALLLTGQKPIDLVVTDEVLEDMTGLAFARKLISVNPMVNCAVVSALSPEDFHEASEGLGILVQLPIEPGRNEGEMLYAQLMKVLEQMGA